LASAQELNALKKGRHGMNNVHFQNKRNDWSTPIKLYNKLDKEFHFTVDVCATAENAKHKHYYTPEMNGLKQDWNGKVCFCNPPYGREISKWVEKASKIYIGTVVMLLPARTDTKWFHDYIYNQNVNSEIRFLKGRVKFDNCKNSAPFPSMIVIFKGITE